MLCCRLPVLFQVIPPHSLHHTFSFRYVSITPQCSCTLDELVYVNHCWRDQPFTRVGAEVCYEDTAEGFRLHTRMD
jgi:hypothetical protein